MYMSKNDRVDAEPDEPSTMQYVMRRTRVFGIKSVTVLATASMLLSGVPTSAIAEELQEAGVIPESTQEQPVEQAETAETSAVEDAGSNSTSTEQGATESDSSQAQPIQETSTDQQQAVQTESATTEADISLSLGNGYLVYTGQQIVAPASKLTVPTNRDITFEAKANNGFELKAVRLTVNGSERTLQESGGVYTVPAADILAGASIALETVAAEDAESAASAISITSLESDDETSVENKDMGSYELICGQTKEVTFSGYADWTYSHKWTSSDKSVAEFDSNGSGGWDGSTYYAHFKAKSNGTATITDVVTKCDGSTNWKAVEDATLTFTVNVVDAPEVKITGSDAVTMGEEIALNLSGAEASQWVICPKSGENPLELVSSDGQSATLRAATGWVFNGASTTVDVKVRYTDPTNQYNTLTSDAFTVTINKRAFKVVAPETLTYGSDYVYPTIVDAVTGEVVSWTGEGGDAFTFNYYKDGKLLGNQSYMKSDGAAWDSLVTSGGEFTVEAVAHDGYYYSGTASATIGKDSSDAKIALSVEGGNTVEQFSSIDLTAKLEPATDGGTYTWSSSNEQVLTVDKNGKVTGVTEGTATVTVTWTSEDGKTVLTATHNVTVTHTTNGNTTFTFYYLNNPAASLDSLRGNWYKLGNGKVDLTGVSSADFPRNNGATKRYDAADRVVEWPDGTMGTTYSVARGSDNWNNIVKQYQSVIQKQLPGVTVTDSDITSITLVPYKLTNNDDGYHVDCSVRIECKGLYSVNYYVDDPSSSDSTGFAPIASSATIREGDTTSITDFISDFATKYPQTKTVDGVEYTLTPWCTDQALTQSVTMPYTVKKSNVSFYAKYVAGRQVIYNLDGGTLGSGTSTTYKVNEGDEYTVLSEPTREGYDFAGWKVEGLDGKETVKSGDKFTMPDNNVTITATWTKKQATVKVNYLWGDESSSELIESDELTDKTYYVGDVAEVDLKLIDGYTVKSLQNGKAVLEAGENVVNVYYYKNVTLTAGDASTVYNGKSQTVSADYTASEDAAVFEGIKASGTGTDAGTYNTTFKSGAKGAVSTDGKYIVTALANGTLTISPATDAVTIKVAGNTGGEKYTGAQQTVTGFTVNASTLPAGISASDVALASGAKAEAAGTNAGTYNMKLTESSFTLSEAAAKNYANVTFEVTDGVLTIAKRKVTLWSEDGHKNYDGQALQRRTDVRVDGTKNVYNNETDKESKKTFDGDGFVEGEGILGKTKTSWFNQNGASDENNIAPGVYDNKFTVQFKDGTNLDNYDITYEYGKLYVNRRVEKDKYAVTVTADSSTVTYNGKAQSVSGLTGTTYVNDKKVVFTITGLSASAEGTDAGEYASKVTGNAVVTDAAGNDVTDQFKISKVDGKLTIDPKAATITAASATKKYDGEALTAGEFTTDGFVEGQGIASATIEGSQTLVGFSANVVKADSWVAAEGTKLSNYSITAQNGTLTVKNRDAKYEITVKANSATATYDGKEHEAKGVETYEFTVEGKKYTVSGLKTENPKATDAGTYTNNISGAAVVKDKDGNNVTSEFEVSTENGSLVIDMATVTLKSASLSKTYDGTELTNGDTALTIETGWAEGEGASYAFTGSQLNAGTSENAFSYTLNSNTKASNYNIATPEFGTLEVKKLSAASLNLVGTNVTHVYDGDSHAAGVATVSPKDADGNDLDVDVTIQYQFAGDDYADWYDDNSFVTWLNATSEPVVVNVRASSANFDGYATATETITIAKRSVRLKTKSATKVYDGTALTTKNDWDGYENGPQTKDGGIVYSDFKLGKDGWPILGTTGSQTEVGSSENTLEYQIKDDRIANYEIANPELGTLTVTKQSIDPDDGSDGGYTGATVNSPSDITYNGADQKWSPTVIDAQGKTLAEGTDYTVSYSTNDFTNAGTITVTIEGKGNYSGTVTREYRIEPREVVLQSESKTWEYDGSEHTATVVAVSGDGFVEGEVSDLCATGSVTLVSQGSVDNSIAYTKNSAYKDANYNVTVHTGKLQVTERSISANGMDVSQPGDVVYSGADQKQAVTVKDGNKTLEKGKDYKVSYSSDTKNVGTVTVTIEGIGNYTGTVERTYQITPAALTVETKGATRVYNGKQLTAEGSIKGFKASETATFKVTGKQKKTGWSRNTYSLDWDGTAKKSNYTVSEKLGILTVTETADEIVVVTTGGSYTYDGTEHAPKVEVSVLPEGYTLETASSNTVVKNVNNTENDGKGTLVTADNLVIRNADGEDVTSSLKITKTTDYLVVNPAELKVITPDASKVYDGKALTAAGSYKGLADGESIGFTTTGTQTEVGESENSFKIEWTGADKSNYTVSKELGTLKVTKQSINKDDGVDGGYKGATVNDPEATTYDGAIHKWVPEIKSEDGSVIDSKNYTVTYLRDGKKTDDFTSAGEITVVIEGQGNYSGKVSKTYTIGKRKVTLTSASETWVYDGSEHQAKTVEVAGDGFVKGEGVEYRDFAVVENATDSAVANIFSYDAVAGTDLKNYDVTVEEGELTVTKASAEAGITLAAESASKVYDGKELVLPAAVAEAKYGNGVKVEYSVDGENWTEDVSEVAATNVNDSTTVKVRASSDVNYAGYVYTTAELKVTPAELTVTTGSAEKPYDGEELTAKDLKIEGLAEGDSITAKTTGAQTEVGSSQNTYAITWSGADESNYVIVEELGTLTVTAVPRPDDNPDNGDDDKPVTPNNNGGGNGGDGATDGTNGNGGTQNATGNANGGFVNTVANVLANGYTAVTGNDTTADTQGEEKVYDSENPLGAFAHDERSCWVHWYMIICCALTLAYGAFVGLRRNKCTGRLERDLKSIIDSAAK